MGKDDQRKVALLKARRKFLKLTTATGGAALLASCGGAFVEPKKGPGGLSVTLKDADKSMLHAGGNS